MFDSVETLFMNLAASLDDIFIAAATFVVLRVVSTWLYWCMHSYFRLSAYVSEVANFGLWLVLTVMVIHHLFGPDISTSLFSGFSIGMGYAFQPYIVSMFTGICNGFMIRTGDTILFNKQPVIVQKLTLFYVAVSTGEYTTYVPHAYFAKAPLSVKSQFAAKQ